MMSGGKQTLKSKITKMHNFNFKVWLFLHVNKQAVMINKIINTVLEIQNNLFIIIAHVYYWVLKNGEKNIVFCSVFISCDLTDLIKNVYVCVCVCFNFILHFSTHFHSPD